MRIILMLLLTGAFALTAWGVGGCGSGGSSGATPNVEGIYDLTNTDCTGFFDSTVEVTQDGSQIIIQATHAGFSDVSGSVNSDGDFTADNSELSCDGQFVSGVATASCRLDDGTDCQVTYELR